LEWTIGIARVNSADGPEDTLLSEALGELQAAHRGWAVRLAEMVRADGPDEHQLACYDLAWARARAAAATATLAQAVSSGKSAAWECAAVLTAEAVLGTQEVAWTLGGEGPDGDFDPRRLTELGAALGPGALARLGDLFLNGDGPGLADDPQQQLLRTTVREFAAREVAPRAQSIHRHDQDLPEEILRGVAQLGLLGTSIPEAYGGSASGTSDFTNTLIATEELSRASLAAGGSLITRPEILVAALLAGGTEAQKSEWLPQIASGQKLVAVAVSEPDYGSDVGGIQCRAETGADGAWLLTGTKLWCTFAGRADVILVLCRTTPGAGHRGASLFIVEKPPFSGGEFSHVQRAGGSLAGRAIPTIGYRGMHTFELVFDQYLVPAGGLLGAEQGRDRGFYLQMQGFDAGRLQTAARAVGLMQAALDASCRYAQERRVFDQPLASRPLTKSTLARMGARLTGARQLSYLAAGAPAAEFSLAAALAKLYACRMAESVTRDGLQLHGAIGYAEESEISRLFVDARVLTIFEGTEEILALRVIAPALLAI
jgi:(2S)-methylsuccinyl-CoA dehydrogenase